MSHLDRSGEGRKGVVAHAFQDVPGFPLDVLKRFLTFQIPAQNQRENHERGNQHEQKNDRQDQLPAKLLRKRSQRINFREGMNPQQLTDCVLFLANLIDQPHRPEGCANQQPHREGKQDGWNLFLTCKEHRDIKSYPVR